MSWMTIQAVVDEIHDDRARGVSADDALQSAFKKHGTELVSEALQLDVYGTILPQARVILSPRVR